MLSVTTQRFGPFRLDTPSRLLTRDGAVVPLAPRTLDLLIVFAMSGGRLLSKNELLRAVWADVNVEEASLAFQISTLRKALGDYGGAWIETVPKHGYRFTADVETTAAAEPGTGPVPLLAPAVKPQRNPIAVLAAVSIFPVIALAVAGWSMFRRSPPVYREATLNISPLTSYPGLEIQPSLSPDGTHLAFAWEGEKKKDLDIYIQLVGQGKPVPLTAAPQPEFSPSWSPDGRMIAFCRRLAADDPGLKGDYGGEIVIVPADGGPERVIARPSPSWTPSGNLKSQALSWFPSSDALAVVGYDASAPQESAHNPVGHPGTRQHEIWMVPLSGEARPITKPTELTWGDGLPSVSPNGRYLAFTRSRNQYGVSAEVYVVGL